MTHAATLPKNYLAAIHITHKALGLSKDDALALKLRVTGVASAGDMTEQQRKRYLSHLQKLQTIMAPPQKPGSANPRPALYRTIDDMDDARWQKVRALWAALADAGVVRNDTDDALMSYVQRQTKVTHWRFLNGYQVNNVIEALKAWIKRAAVQEPAHG